MDRFLSFVHLYNGKHSVRKRDSKTPSTYMEFEGRILIESNRKKDLSFLHPPQQTQEELYNSLLTHLIKKKYKTSVEHTINFIKSVSSQDEKTSHNSSLHSASEERSSHINTMLFINDVQQKDKSKSYIKTTILDCYLTNNININYKIKFSSEVPAETFDTQLCDFIRVKSRLSFYIKDWRIDITLVKSFRSLDVSLLKLAKASMFKYKTAADYQLYDRNYVDACEIEFEFIEDLSKLSVEKLSFIDKQLLEGMGYSELDMTRNKDNSESNEDSIESKNESGELTKEITEENLMKGGLVGLINFNEESTESESTVIPSSNHQNKSRPDIVKSDISDYQKAIYRLASILKPEIKHKFNSDTGSGLKQLGNQVFEISRDDYFNKIRPHVDLYYIASKIDGLRTIIYFHEHTVEFINDSVTIFTVEQEYKTTVLDTELYITAKDETCVIPFDILYLDGNNVMNKKFSERLELMKTFVLTLTPKQDIKGSFENEIKENKTDEDNDGDDELVESKSDSSNESSSDESESDESESDESESSKDSDDSDDSKSSKDSDSLVETQYRLFGSSEHKSLIKLDPNAKLPEFKLKTFIKLTQNYCKEIKALASDLTYTTDGIIFTPDDKYDEIVYKWKPVEKLSVDFLIRKCPASLLGRPPYENKPSTTLYLLYCGIRSSTFRNMGLSHIKNYRDLFPPTKQVDKHQAYIPTEFSPSDYDYAYIYWHPSSHEIKDDLDSTVGEFVLTHESMKGSGKGSAKGLNKISGKMSASKTILPLEKILQSSYKKTYPQWKLTKIRHDRMVEVKRGNYFGNNYHIAESIWRTFDHPLTLNELCLSSDDTPSSYFMVHDNPLYASQRAYNSYVKSRIFDEHLMGSNWVIDIGSGKGQDIFRYNKAQVNHLLCIDKDNIALDELVKRKQELVNNSHRTLSINVCNLDMNEDYTKNVKYIFDSIHTVPYGGVDCIVSNFTFHYFLKSLPHMKNAIKFIHSMLKPEGTFIMTAFDGKAVHDKLVAHKGKYETKVDSTVKYSIKANYKTSRVDVDNLTGESIDVLLPFSDGDYYTEYLVEANTLEEEFKAMGFTRYLYKSFSSFMDGFDNNKNKLSDDDKTYVGLYYVTGFKKNPAKSR